MERMSDRFGTRFVVLLGSVLLGLGLSPRAVRNSSRNTMTIAAPESRNQRSRNVMTSRATVSTSTSLMYWFTGRVRMRSACRSVTGKSPFL